MNILDQLKKDHDTVRSLFEKGDKILKRFPEINKDELDPLVKEIKDELEAHNTIEEEVFYNTLKEKAPDSLLPYVSFEEHQIAMKGLKELKNNKLDEKEYAAKLYNLKTIILHHIKEEESKVFPLAKECLTSKEQKELGIKFQQRKKEEGY